MLYVLLFKLLRAMLVFKSLDRMSSACVNKVIAIFYESARRNKFFIYFSKVSYKRCKMVVGF